MSIENKLTYLNETKNQIKSALNTPYNVFRDYPTLISKYVKNQPKSIVEGSNAICENAVALPCNIDVNGNSYQETTEGYNKFKVNPTMCNFSDGVPVGKTSNGTINSYDDNNINYTTKNASYTGFISEPISLKSGETLIVTAILNGSTSLRCGIIKVNDNGSYAKLHGTRIITSSNLVTSYTLTEDTTVVVGFWTNTDMIYTINLSNLMATTKENATYEPYTNGASPNTEYKQDIEVIEAYNKFDLANYTYEMGYYNTSGNFVNSNLTVHTTMKIPVEANTDYSLCNIKLISETNEGLAQSIVGAVYFYNENYNFIKRTDLIKVKDVYNFKTLENCKFIELQISISANDSDVNNKYFDDIKDKFMIVKGIFTKDNIPPYLPYGHIGLVQRGNNLSPLSKISTLANGYINRDSGTLGKVKNGKTYTISFNCSSEHTGTNYVQIRVYNNGTSTTDGGFNYSSGNKLSVKFTPKQDGDIYLSGNFGSQYTDVLYDIQVEEGETATEYEPYIEPKTIPINLNGNSIAKVGDIKDILNIGLDGSVSIDKKTAKDILNGVTKLFVTKGGTTNNNIFLTNAFNTKIKGPATNSTVEKHLSNYFRGSFSTNYLYSNNVQGSSIRSDKVFGIAFGLDTEITTVELANAFLKEHSVEVLAPLQEEYYETIPLPSIKPIELFEGTNIFELVTNLGTTMAVEYIVDAESLTNTITELGNAVIELGGTI